jgi:hypothetical protein
MKAFTSAFAAAILAKLVLAAPASPAEDLESAVTRRNIDWSFTLCTQSTAIHTLSI